MSGRTMRTRPMGPVGLDQIPERAPLAMLQAGLTEKVFQEQVLELAKWRGWQSYHTRNSMGSAQGYPDLTLLRGDRLIFAELKTLRGKATGAQQRWLSELRAVSGIEVYLWRPTDIAAIERLLR